jgi:hypothetical protein
MIHSIVNRSNSSLALNSPMRQDVLLHIWMALQLVGAILLPLALLVIVFSPSIKRNPTVTNLMNTWFISAIIFLLLFFAGKHTGPEPPKALCIAQSSLVYASIPMNSAAALSLVLNLWFTVQIAFDPTWGRSWAKWRMGLLVTVPYIMGLIFLIAALAASLKFPEDISRARNFFYCSLNGHGIGNSAGIFCSVVMFAVVIIECIVGVKMYRNWRVARTGEGLSISNTIRITVFSAYGALAGISALISIWRPDDPLPYMVLATLPIAAFLVFGTQKDMIKASCFWRNSSAKPQRIADEEPKQWTKKEVDLV